MPTDRSSQRKTFRICRLAQRLDLRIFGGSLMSAVPGLVVVQPVPVIFAVRFVMFVVVRDPIIQREAVVAGDEVHALAWLPFAVTIDVWAAQQPLREEGAPCSCPP